VQGSRLDLKAGSPGRGKTKGKARQSQEGKARRGKGKGMAKKGKARRRKGKAKEGKGKARQRQALCTAWHACHLSRRFMGSICSLCSVEARALRCTASHHLQTTQEMQQALTS